MNYRKHIRLPNYDYSQNGYYFVTVCTHMRRPIFVDAVKSLVEQKINQIPEYYPTVSIDYFVIMKNHIHAIIIINNNVGAESYSARNDESIGPIKNRPLQKHIGLPTIIRSFKSWVQREMCVQIWQRGYYEHVIRNEKALNKIREYIMNNPDKEKYDWDKLDV